MRTRQGGVVTPSGRLKWAAVVSALGMGIVNFVGFLDAQTGSALGCGPDWPLCNGQVIPSISNVHVLIEFAHRALVGGFALISVLVSLWALWKYRRYIEVKILAGLCIAFIIVQSGLGALAVVFTNPPAVLALHLGFGLLALIGAVLLAVFIFQLSAELDGRPSGLAWRSKTPATTRRWVIGIWIYTYIAMYWGSYVAFRGGGEACSTWPLCNGQVFPGFTGNVGLDFIHRLFAVGLAVLAVLLLIHLRHARRDRMDLARGATWFLIAVLMQIASGANVALSHVATGPYLLHIATLMFLFSVLSYLGLQTMPAVGPKDAPVHDTRQSMTEADGVPSKS